MDTLKPKVMFPLRVGTAPPTERFSLFHFLHPFCSLFLFTSFCLFHLVSLSIDSLFLVRFPFRYFSCTARDIITEQESEAFPSAAEKDKKSWATGHVHSIPESYPSVSTPLSLDLGNSFFAVALFIIRGKAYVFKTTNMRIH